MLCADERKEKAKIAKTTKIVLNIIFLITLSIIPDYKLKIEIALFIRVIVSFLPKISARINGSGYLSSPERAKRIG